MCVCPSPRLLITNGMIWTPCDWFKKFYGLYMAAVVYIVSKHGLNIDVHRRNQPDKDKLALLINICSHLKQFLHAKQDGAF